MIGVGLLVLVLIVAGIGVFWVLGIDEPEVDWVREAELGKAPPDFNAFEEEEDMDGDESVPISNPSKQ